MEFKHTPGPWITHTEPDGSFDIEAEGMGTTGGTLVICSRNPHSYFINQMHNNAKLIAAAPDLLEALINAHALHPCEMYAAAIEKATGQTVKRTR